MRSRLIRFLSIIRLLVSLIKNFCVVFFGLILILVGLVFFRRLIIFNKGSKENSLFYTIL